MYIIVSVTIENIKVIGKHYFIILFLLNKKDVLFLVEGIF